MLQELQEKFPILNPETRDRIRKYSLSNPVKAVVADNYQQSITLLCVYALITQVDLLLLIRHPVSMNASCSAAATWTCSAGDGASVSKPFRPASLVLYRVVFRCLILVEQDPIAYFHQLQTLAETERVFGESAVRYSVCVENGGLELRQ
jgi:hypothetical protein